MFVEANTWRQQIHSMKAAFSFCNVKQDQWEKPIIRDLLLQYENISQYRKLIYCIVKSSSPKVDEPKGKKYHFDLKHFLMSVIPNVVEEFSLSSPFYYVSVKSMQIQVRSSHAKQNHTYI